MHRRSYLPGNHIKRNREVLDAENQILKRELNRSSEFINEVVSAARKNAAEEAAKAQKGFRGLVGKVKSIFTRKVGAK